MSELELYYGRRAPEYEEIYYRSDDVRKAELAQAAAHMAEIVEGKQVLELACGTGFWTEIAADSAKTIVATDVNTTMIDVAKQKSYPRDNVTFKINNAYDPDTVPGDFDAGMANFWLSHVPKSKLNDFLRAFHGRLGTGAEVFMIDNTNTAFGGEFVEEPGSEDTFKRRQLTDGSKHTVLKNYYSSHDLVLLLGKWADDLRIEFADYYWWLSYSIARV